MRCSDDQMRTHENNHEVENKKIFILISERVCVYCVERKCMWRDAMRCDEIKYIFIYLSSMYKSYSMTATPMSTYFCLSLWISLVVVVVVFAVVATISFNIYFIYRTNRKAYTTTYPIDIMYIYTQYMYERMNTTYSSTLNLLMVNKMCIYFQCISFSLARVLGYMRC